MVDNSGSYPDSLSKSWGGAVGNSLGSNPKVVGSSPTPATRELPAYLPGGKLEIDRY